MDSKRKAIVTNAGSEVTEDRASKRRRIPNDEGESAPSETSETTTKHGLQLMHIIRETKDRTGRVVATDFLELPNRKELPDYYEIIKMPIAIDTIERKLRKKEFPDLTALESYFKRMVQNAKEYNEKGSKIYEDAERLRKAMTNFMTKHNPAYKTPGYVPISTPIPGEDANDEEEGNVDTAVVDVPSDTPAKRTSRDRSSRHGQSTPRTAPTPSTSTEQSTSNSFKGLTFQQAQEKIVLDTIKHKTDPDDEFPTFEVFLNLPPRSLKDYYQLITYPLCLRKLQKRVLGVHGRNDTSGVSDFRNWAAFEEEASHIWKNAWLYNEDRSEISKLAKELQAFFTALISEAKKVVTEPVAPKIKLKMPEPEPAHKITIKLGTRASGGNLAPAATRNTTSSQVDAHDGVRKQATSVAPAASSAHLDQLAATSDAPASVVSSALQKAAMVKNEEARNSPLPVAGIQRPSSRAGGLVGASGLARSHMSGPSPSPQPPVTQGQYEYKPANHFAPPAAGGFDSKLRAPGKDATDALIKNLTICTDPRLNISRHLRLDISPDDQLSQQSVTIHLPSTHYFLNINPEIPPALMERQYKMFVTSGNQRLQALPAAPGQAADKRRPNFEARLTPGMNKIEVELIAALPRGTVKPLSGPDAELERVTVFVNLLKV